MNCCLDLTCETDCDSMKNEDQSEIPNVLLYTALGISVMILICLVCVQISCGLMTVCKNAFKNSEPLPIEPE